MEKQNKNATLDLVTVQEACDLFRTSRQTIGGWVRRDILRVAKVGRRAYFRRSDIESLINKQLDQ